jgi:branched-chain amino acid transport system permease protein
VILGAVLVVYIPLRFIEIAPYKYLIFGLALVILMIFRPQGLLPARQRLLAYGRIAYNKLGGRAAPGAEPPGTSGKEAVK